MHPIFWLIALAGLIYLFRRLGRMPKAARSQLIERIFSLIATVLGLVLLIRGIHPLFVGAGVLLLLLPGALSGRRAPGFEERQAWNRAWREQYERGMGGGQHNPGHNPGQMTIPDAYRILGLSDGANREDVITTHRKLIQKVHPDRGGSTFLATQINQAKDLLMSHIGK